jgi:L-fuconolactonase
MSFVNRRLFMGISAGAALSDESAGATKIPIIDTHIHLFDTARPQGVPWPDKKQTELYLPALPARYRKIAVPLGVTGAVVIEASPWLDDNQWVLDIAQKNPIIVGVVGDLEPGDPAFASQLDRYHKNPLFRGIRYGNLWDRSLATQIERPEFVAGLKLLSQAGLSLDTANPNPDLMAAMVRVTDRVPELRVILDHLPGMQLPTDPAARRTVQSHLRELGHRPNVYVKLSGVFLRIGGQVPRDLSVYRATLDDLIGTFGEDRVLYGSDWPNSDQWRPYNDVLSLVQEYFAGKGAATAAKYFWKNSLQAYRWIHRDSSQPTA